MVPMVLVRSYICLQCLSAILLPSGYKAKLLCEGIPALADLSTAQTPL